VGEQQLLLTALRSQVQELVVPERRNSGNSSQPPTSDPPWRQRRQKPPTGKKRGGQHGHPGRYRRLVPASAMDHVVVCTPDTGGHFPESSPRQLKVRRVHVFELPPIRPVITEYQAEARHGRPRLRCAPFAAPPDPGAADGPLRRIPLAEHPLCFGGAYRPRLGRAVCGVRFHSAARAAVGADETSWKEVGTLHWIRAAVTKRFAFFHVDIHRSRAVFQALLPDTGPGVINVKQKCGLTTYYFSRSGPGRPFAVSIR